MKRCRHKMVAHGPTRTRCSDCDALISRGRANDTGVAAEIRAAEMYACAMTCAWDIDAACRCTAGKRRDDIEELAKEIYMEMWA